MSGCACTRGAGQKAQERETSLLVQVFPYLNLLRSPWSVRSILIRPGKIRHCPSPLTHVQALHPAPCVSPEPWELPEPSEAEPVLRR